MELYHTNDNTIAAVVSKETAFRTLMGFILPKCSKELFKHLKR